jgi:D-3-phosphoglycerate dehydrogenase
VIVRVFLTHDPEDLEAYYGRALAPLRELAEVVVNPLPRNLTTDELIEAAAGCEVIVSHRSTPGPAAVFEARTELLAFLRCAVDIRDIDVEAATAAGVIIGHAEKSYVPSTAELAVALMLDVARHVSMSTVDYQRGAVPAQRPGRQLRGATAGLIGYGSIGRYLAEVLCALGMDVLVTDPYVDVGSAGPDPAGDGPGVVQVSLDELFARADFVLPLAPVTPETEGLIDAAALGSMRAGAVLVNVSRGELLDEDAVAAALDSGRLGGLAMDVGSAPDQRPAPALAGRPGVVATPHLGGLTPENADAQAASSVEQVAAIVAGEMPPRVVDPGAAVRLRHWWAQRHDRAPTRDPEERATE